MDVDSICGQISSGLIPQAEELIRIWTYAGFGKVLRGEFENGYFTDTPSPKKSSDVNVSIK
ncbi:hypothetical protein ACTXT7_006186 [Hymenolepis weldensis]